MEYDLVRLYEHPLRFRLCLPYAIVCLGGQPTGASAVEVQWRRNSQEVASEEGLVLRWDVSALQQQFQFESLTEEIEILRTRDQDRATQTELTAVVVAVAVMAHLEPEARFTQRSRKGTGHDYFI